MTATTYETEQTDIAANWPTLAVAALGSFLVILDVTVVAIALPSSAT